MAVLATLGVAAFASRSLFGNLLVRRRRYRVTAVNRLDEFAAGRADCHALAAAGSSGNAGPDLDETKPDAARVRDLVTNGKGVMPSFEDELTSREIADVAAFDSTSTGR